MGAPRTDGLLRAADRSITIAGLGVLPVLVLATILVYSAGHGWGWGLGFDFHAFWSAGRNVLHGASPYPPPTRAALSTETQFVYPAPAALLFVPLALLPFKVAAVVFVALLSACAPLTLWLLGVRDWRCYGVTLLWIPVIDCIRLGAISLLLALLTAVVWRYRDSKFIGAGALALLVALKIFLWPLGVWLLVRRRVRSAVTAAVTAAALIGVAWLAIGFAGLADYPRMLGTLTSLLQRTSYSISALGVVLGLTSQQAHICAFVIGGLLLAAMPFLNRRPDGDKATFILALAASFAFLPIVWEHYYVVFLVPLAITRPRLSGLWFLPLVFWLAPNQSHGNVAKILVGLGVASVLVYRMLRHPAPEAEPVPRGLGEQPVLGTA